MSSDRLMKWLYGYNTTTSLDDTNDFGNHAPGIIKSMQILEAQFGNLHASSPSSVSNNMNDINNNDNNNNNNNNNNMLVLNTSSAYDHHDLPRGSSSHSQQPSSQTNNVLATDGDEVGASNNNNMKRKNEEIVEDGRIHSLPHNKHGPYICSKCNKVLLTSQKFASHVASTHYKFETEEEKKKRYMSRIRKRPNLRIQKLNDGTTTFVPVVASVDQSHAASVNYDYQNMSAPAPPLNGVKVKLELADN